MAENKELDIAESYGKAEEFINQNKQTVTTIAIAIAVLIGGYYYYASVYMPQQEKEAQAQIYLGQIYFENDSLNLALNGDGNFLGMLYVADEYSGTKAGDLANYYAGLCYLRLGDYRQAIDFLKEFDGEDMIVSTLALGAIGDAYMELNDAENGVKYYTMAMEKNQNEFSTPILMLKTGMALEKQEKLGDAKEIYEQIKKDYPESQEGKDIDKYIARIDARM